MLTLNGLQKEMVGKPVFVVPFLYHLNLPEEDGLGLERRLAWEKTYQNPPKSKAGDLAECKKVVVVAYPHTAMSDDLCPLESDSRFRVEWRQKRIPQPFPHTTAVILPGSRLTRTDLQWLHRNGWVDFLKRHIQAGGVVLGICGGYQMLGETVSDPEGVEGLPGTEVGLGLFTEMHTTLSPPEQKVITPRRGTLSLSGTPVQGFELHCGISELPSLTVEGNSETGKVHPLLACDDGTTDGMRIGNIRGTYMHGILASPKARVELLVPPNDISFQPLLDINDNSEDPLDRLACLLYTSPSPRD